MYIPICLILIFYFIFLAVAIFFTTTEKWARIAKTSSLVSAAAGAVLAVVSLIVFFSKKSSIKNDPDLKSWYSDVYSTFIIDIMLIFATVFILLIISTFIQNKYAPLRCALSSASSILLLIFGYISSLLMQSKKISLDFEIKSFSIALSLIMTFCVYFDFKRLHKKLSNESAEKKENRSFQSKRKKAKKS